MYPRCRTVQLLNSGALAIDHVRVLAQGIIELAMYSSHCRDPQAPTSMSIPRDPPVAAPRPRRFDCGPRALERVHTS
jgi:hypothetical protein